MPLTAGVRNYLLQCVAKAGAKPERIMSEMQLCAKFGVSRITVRRAIQTLEQSKQLIRLPGRQGAFTNPELAMAVTFIVGILCLDGTRNYFNTARAEILTGFMGALRNVNCDFEFLNLNLNGNLSVAQEIENMALDGLFWITPSESRIDDINELLQRQYPVVIMDSIYDTESRKPNGNTILRDYEFHAAQYARLMWQRQLQRVVWLGSYNISAKRFQKEMRKHGTDLPRKFFIDTEAEIPEKLPRLLTSETADAIICTGGTERYNCLLQTLEAQGNRKNIPIFMAKNHLTSKLQKKYSQWKIEITPSYYDCKALGRSAGQRMAEFLQGKITSFPSCVVPVTKKSKEE
ncbi:MAG TPA: GntR family transcriptional regulator [Lentisphaeria bacterium]|nr:GntR family transcriptional regulator [Lentisphaeria bacterium]